MQRIVAAICFLLTPIVGGIALATGFFKDSLHFAQVTLFAWPIVAVCAWVLMARVFGLRTDHRPAAIAWSGLSKLFHWSIAACILGTTALMYHMQHLGDTKHDLVLRAEYARLLKLHKSIGLIVLFLVGFRFLWNLRRERPPLPDTTTPSQRRAAIGAHHFLYLTMLAVPLIGWMASMTYGGKTTFFGWFELPVWLAKDEYWVALLQPAHIYLAWGMLAVVAVHIGAALWHHFVKRDATLVQMLPRD